MRRELVIIGAGPAGMSAAIAAVRAGCAVTVVDENPQAGGQIYRQPPGALKMDKADGDGPEHQRGRALLEQFHGLGSRLAFLSESTVWGIFEGHRVAVSRGAGWRMIEADNLILSPGAHEYVPPFPGWTLPGVMTPGAAQTMVKAMGVLPGRRILLAGTGPFLLVVAAALHRVGARIVGVVEAATTFTVLAALPGLLAQPGMLIQGWRYLRQLRRAGIPMHRGHIVIEARGDEQVRSALIAPCDRNWFPDRTRARAIETDTLCVGYGFIPRVQLLQLAGCRLRFTDELGGWVPQLDENLQSSVPGIWVAGDGGGVAGAVVAELEGTLAGLAAAFRIGRLTARASQTRSRPLKRRLASLRRFRAALDGICRIRPGLSSLATPTTLMCRCEELTRDAVDVGIAAGGTDIRTLKVMTRLGMGPCQGRMCWPATARHIARRTTRTMQQVGPLSVRPPITPVTLGALAAQPETGPVACVSNC